MEVISTRCPDFMGTFVCSVTDGIKVDGKELAASVLGIDVISGNTVGVFGGNKKGSSDDVDRASGIVELLSAGDFAAGIALHAVKQNVRMTAKIFFIVHIH